MSTAGRVPETWELDGDDARKTLTHIGRKKLLRDSFMRLRYADGFSHARSLAFVTTLVLVQGTIAIVGLAAVLGDSRIARTLVHVSRAALPGPAHHVLTDAITQAYQAGASSQWLPLVLGTLGALVTGATLFGQLERALNRLYGIEQDRAPLQKYGLALVLTFSAGICATGAFVLFAFGREIGNAIGGDARTLWNILRWPVAIALIFATTALLFRWSPRRRQPAWSWLAYGAGVSMFLWSVVTLGLGLMLSVSSSFGETYGPLAGIVALQIWSLLSTVSILYGAAVAAQLEAVRAGEPAVQEPEKLDADTPQPADDLLPSYQ